MAYILGHETHGHPQTSTAGCAGDISVPIDEAHAGAANISAVFVATYTDNPGGGETPQQGSAEVRLVPAARRGLTAVGAVNRVPSGRHPEASCGGASPMGGAFSASRS